MDKAHPAARFGRRLDEAGFGEQPANRVFELVGGDGFGPAMRPGSRLRCLGVGQHDRAAIDDEVITGQDMESMGRRRGSRIGVVKAVRRASGGEQ